MLDLDLLRSLVSVIDAGSFTRAGQRVHRTQSTVSQQIRRLEEMFGRPLLRRQGKRVTPTEEGERLLSYARRLLALADEAHDVVARPKGDGVVRFGVSEDFAAYRLTEMLSDFARSRPSLRLHVRCGKSVKLRSGIERGELDLALIKRVMGETGGIAAWPERLHWITTYRHSFDFHHGRLPLAVFEQGCLYRNRAIHALETLGRAWHIAYTSASLLGIQAAVSAGLGVSILPELAILPDHRVLDEEDGFPRIADTETALVVAPEASLATRRLAEALVDFCNAADPRVAHREQWSNARAAQIPAKQRGISTPLDRRRPPKSQRTAKS
jgi:DNA-binding transcriptional LysR family regulator